MTVLRGIDEEAQEAQHAYLKQRLKAATNVGFITGFFVGALITMSVFIVTIALTDMHVNVTIEKVAK